LLGQRLATRERRAIGRGWPLTFWDLEYQHPCSAEPNRTSQDFQPHTFFFRRAQKNAKGFQLRADRQTMDFFWLLSTSHAPELPLSSLIPRESIEGLAAEMLRKPAATLILDIRNEDDKERCLPLIEDLHGVVPVWIHEPGATVASSIMWMKTGASHVITGIDEIAELIKQDQDQPFGRLQAGGLIGRSRAMAKVAADIQMVADRRCNVLIEGETGTGKEVVAREIHKSGTRSRGPWIAVNCSAIPEALLEAELFGHVRGAFTGAVQARAGKFEAANHGSIFLDEIGDMPLATQAKLLRVIQEREVERLGGNERIRLDVRVIAATNVDLEDRVRQGLFRQDLFYRLNVFRIELPALRSRTDDIPVLAQHFVDKVCSSEHFAPKRLDTSTLERLEGYGWPGNVRELENVIEAAVIISGGRSTLFPSDLRLSSRLGAPASLTVTDGGAHGVSLPYDGLDYQRTLEEFEKSLLTQALTRSRGNKTAAAFLLRMKRTTLTARMRVLEARLPRLVA
jgi:transcriptional regulator with GAF, ATPase, and Fis domain